MGIEMRKASKYFFYAAQLVNIGNITSSERSLSTSLSMYVHSVIAAPSLLPFTARSTQPLADLLLRPVHEATNLL